MIRYLLLIIASCGLSVIASVLTTLYENRIHYFEQNITSYLKHGIITAVIIDILFFMFISYIDKRLAPICLILSILGTITTVVIAYRYKGDNNI